MKKRAGSSWTGGAAVLAGLGAFKGHAGDNRPHCHWAHQLSIGLDGPVRLLAGGLVHEAPALFVRAGSVHQLIAGPVLSCYIDPTSMQAHALVHRLAGSEPIQALPDELTRRIRDAFDPDASMTEAGC